MQGVNLMTRGEVVFWSGLSEFSPCNLNDLYAVIFKDICECFGEAFYDELIEHLIDYSGTPEYDNDTSYAIGDVVIFEGCYWIAVEEAEGSFPGAENTCWKLAPKFDKECLNDFWCNASFAQYLSYLVVRESIVDASIPLRNAGAVVNYADGYQKTNKDLIRLSQANYSKKIERLFILLEKWIYACKNDCFHCTKQLAISCCGGCGCVKEKCRCDHCDKDKTNSFRLIVC